MPSGLCYLHFYFTPVLGKLELTGFLSGDIMVINHRVGEASSLMKDLICDEFQNVVGDLLIRHHSILDILSKLSEANCRVNRAVVKSVTDCGCMSVEATKLQIPDNVNSIEELRQHMDNHLRGVMCNNCEDVIISELGKLLFYSAALCNTLITNLYYIFITEYKKASAIAVYNMT